MEKKQKTYVKVGLTLQGISVSLYNEERDALIGMLSPDEARKMAKMLFKRAAQLDRLIDDEETVAKAAEAAEALSRVQRRD